MKREGILTHLPQQQGAQRYPLAAAAVCVHCPVDPLTRLVMSMQTKKNSIYILVLNFSIIYISQQYNVIFF